MLLSSLITALAAASGHNLVRINLSEQTDIADLMGSDLPVQNSNSGGASFEWCDGILLTAIKEGSWVLLDELNLASQSVLEGLNSCLDHRATVFIPELGQTFHCPDTFRIFAAQNPLAQGGGRKGLPKSFLNRFTKVFVDPLTNSDLRAIVIARFPSFERTLIDKIIDFNNRVYRDVVERREYGADGSPWEFNLRDVFRWCELISGKTATNKEYARDLYFQRFRNSADRERVDQTFKEYFGCSLQPSRPPEFRITNKMIHIGQTSLRRFSSNEAARDNSLRSESTLLLSRLLPMEAVSRCISSKWPCLLVGPTGSGKTSIITGLAELCNVTLVEQCLSPSSDVSELVGCFEQVESMSDVRETVEKLCALTEEYLLHHGFDPRSCSRPWELSSALTSWLEDLDDSDHASFKSSGGFHRSISELAQILLRESEENPSFPRDIVHTMVSKINTYSNRTKQKDDDAGHFIWRDGLLVEAMTKGYWLLLENVNLCPSSVLDRLNSVMEKDGELLLSECGTQGEGSYGSSHRLIKPHPNFRVFLTMNPANGEISRAMRNRCVEISLLQSMKTNNSAVMLEKRQGSSMDKEEKLDFFGALHLAGARSLQLASGLLEAHFHEYKMATKNGEELPYLQGMAGAVSTLAGLLCQGLSGKNAIYKYLQLFYEIEEDATKELFEVTEFRELAHKHLDPLPSNFSIGSACSLSAQRTVVEWDARLLRTFSGANSNAGELLISQKLGLFSLQEIHPKLAEKYSIVNSLQACGSDDRLRPLLIQTFLSRFNTEDAETRFSFLIGLDSVSSSTLSWMVSSIRDTCTTVKVFNEPMIISDNATSADANSITSIDYHAPTKTDLLQLGRLAQKLREQKWYWSVSKRHTMVLDSLSGLAAMEASYCIHESVVDRSALLCPVTPILYPFFLALDDLINNLLSDCNHSDEGIFIELLSNVLDERDRLWCLLEVCPMSLQSDSLLGFQDAEFIVQWRWLKKSLLRLFSQCSGKFSSDTSMVKRKVDVIVAALDEAVFGSTVDSWSSHALRKKMMRPIVPRRAPHWETMFKLKGIAEEFTTVFDHRFDPLEESLDPIEVKDLMDSCHPVFFFPSDDKTRLLAALCTTHWSSTVPKKSERSMLSSDAFYQKLRDSYQNKRQTFRTMIATAKVDMQINTVENQLSVEMLEKMKGSSSAALSNSDTYSSLSETLLSCFGRVQLSVLAEFWCAHEERKLCGEICKYLSQSKGDTQLQKQLFYLLPAVKHFVKLVLSSTTWSVNDIRPYQTLVWAIEGWSDSHGSIRYFVRNLMTTILFTASKHMWSNSFIHTNSISMNLELPNMWTDDESVPSRRSFIPEPNDRSYGSVRLRQQVRNEFMLRMLGEQLSLSRFRKPVKFRTMENHLHRIQQYREVVKMLSSFHFSASKSGLFVANYLLIDILEALDSNYSDKETKTLLSLVVPVSLASDNSDIIDDLGKSFSNRFLRSYGSTLITPLLKSLQQAWKLDVNSEDYSKEIAKAWIFVGLLRMTILVPDTPLDPGRAPLAKVTLIDQKLSDVGAKVTALRLESGFVRGDFNPESPDVLRLLAKGQIMLTKRESQLKKVVERISTAPPFHELYRETREFMDNISSNSKVLKIVQDISEASDSKSLEAARGRAMNWQRTAMAFCKRLVSEYEAYEDVTTSLFDSVKMVQDGLHTIAQISSDQNSACVSELFGLLLKFPMGKHSAIISASMELSSPSSKESVLLKTRKKSDFQYAISLASLTRLALQKHVSGLDKNECSACSILFDRLIRSHLAGQDENSNSQSTEDVEEEEFREQFPDHRMEFRDLLDEEVTLEEVIEESEFLGHDRGHPDETQTLSDTQIELLCFVYHDLFSANTQTIADSTRALAFHGAYSAALEIESLFRCSKQTISDSGTEGAHCFAMSLTSIPKNSSLPLHSHLHRSQNLIDFQKDPCPGESVLATGPLEQLMARATQLLNAFPGHSILLGIGRVCDKVRKFDVMTTPIGKVMTGLEVILRQAQDWEQHASDRVRLGNSLHEVGRLVAKWRKLELESWPKLLRARQDRHIRKARKHWLRLHGILHNDGTDTSHTPEADEKFSVDLFTEFQTSTPKWVWKGVTCFIPVLDDPPEINDLTELVKALDTFVLTSPLGEFEERLKLLEACAKQLQVEYNASEKCSKWRLHQSRALFSIWCYYEQFSPFLSSKLDTLRTPIEAKLKDEVKLAKWDEQSYYALAESTERNHRKLMKILFEFEECLGLNVGLLIQEETLYGIRSDVNTRGGVCTSVPSDISMFPLSRMVGKESKKSNVKEKFFKMVKKMTWTNVNLMGLRTDSHIGKIAKYAKKMQQMKEKEALLVDSCAQVGENSASYLCNAIFDRIESLRTKSTRPMKERALVELFRELKRNGFTMTKWAVPNELKCMEQIFQLPKPRLADPKLKSEEALTLDKAERYYMRCLVEINAFRSELLMLGSQHMSKRQMDMMLSFTESGLLVLAQQRSVIANIVKDTGILEDRLLEMCIDDESLPIHQTTLHTFIKKYKQARASTIESIHQLSLLLRSSQTLLEEGLKTDWARDTVAKLESFLDASPTIFENVATGLVTWKQLRSVENDCTKIQEMAKIVRECRDKCKELSCFPANIFDVTIAGISETLKLGFECRKASTLGENVAYIESHANRFHMSLSAAIERTLIIFQNYSRDFAISSSGEKTKEAGGTENENDDLSIMDCHKALIRAWEGMDLKRINHDLKDVLLRLCELHDDKLAPRDIRDSFAGLVLDTSILVKHIHNLSESLRKDTLAFYSSMSRLNYVLLRVFRVLVSKGYCSDETSEDNGGEEDGDINGMTFEDEQDGTGMGEGEGKRDVTDQLESEEQLLGLKSEQDHDEDTPENQDSRQLNEDEAEQGMEMEGDFEGEMCDLPDKPEEEEGEDQEGEEIDREMGEDSSPDEQVVDEKMWNESDDEEEVNKSEEKFEMNSNVEGEAIEGETRTKDDSDDPKPAEDEKEKESEQKPGKEDAIDMEGNDGDGEDINEDNDSQYEERHGVDIRDDEKDDDNEINEDDDQMKFDDDLCLDGDEDSDSRVDNEVEPDDAFDDSQSTGSDKVNEDEGETPPPHDSAEEENPADNSNVPIGDGATEFDDEMKEETDTQDEAIEKDIFEENVSRDEAIEAHGIRSSQGADAVKDDVEEEENDEGGEKGDDVNDGTSGDSQTNQAQRVGVGMGDSEEDGHADESNELPKEESSSEIPNPFKNPGDASKFWHQKLNLVESSPEVEESSERQDKEMEKDSDQNKGDHEYTSPDQQSSGQVLGEATEEEAVELEQGEHKENQDDVPGEEKKEKKVAPSEQQTRKNNESKQHNKPDKANKDLGQASIENSDSFDDELENIDEKDDEETSDDSVQSGEEYSDEDNVGNKIVSDLSKLTVAGRDTQQTPRAQVIEDEQVAGISSAEAAEARLRWLQIQGETHNLSRRLCEKLRLVMEPLVASKLKGDYRSGKRINMKRVIGYIASGYRKDKIWLRRTKPAKRDYRVLLAVDDSESMKKSGAGDMALRAMATLAVGMNQLEIGELGIASFGDDMKLLHPYHLPFTSESGADMVMNFGFNQRRTRTALCVESALASLDQFGDHSSMQLVFLISDGRIERDSRAILKRLVREMVERNILLAMIIVEGKGKKKDSIVNMKEVTFVKGKPVVKRFIEDYPFPYYIILDDTSALPEVLGDALRQWFEILSQLQGSS